VIYVFWPVYIKEQKPKLTNINETENTFTEDIIDSSTREGSTYFQSLALDFRGDRILSKDLISVENFEQRKLKMEESMNKLVSLKVRSKRPSLSSP
jgi:hypothetical protein